MTIKTLSYIHNLLVNAEQSAALKLKWHNEEYYQIVDDFREKLVSKSKYEEACAEHERLASDHSQAFAALREFEEKEW